MHRLLVRRFFETDYNTPIIEILSEIDQTSHKKEQVDSLSMKELRDKLLNQILAVCPRYNPNIQLKEKDLRDVYEGRTA